MYVFCHNFIDTSFMISIYCSIYCFLFLVLLTLEIATMKRASSDDNMHENDFDRKRSRGGGGGPGHRPEIRLLVPSKVILKMRCRFCRCCIVLERIVDG